MSDQVDVIQEKQQQKEKEKEEDRMYAALQRQQNEAAKKREQEALQARKNMTREQLAKALSDQMEATQKTKEAEKAREREGNPYLPIGIRPEEHHKHCKRCGTNFKTKKITNLGKDIVQAVRYGRLGTIKITTL